MQAAGDVLGARRVLVVEDEYFIADDMANALTRHGAQVVGPIPRLGEALAYVESAGRLDLAVLDINLGGEDVFAVAAALRRRGTPFVFVTGYDRTRLPPEFREVACWEKPVEPDLIAGALMGGGTPRPAWPGPDSLPAGAPA